MRRRLLRWSLHVCPVPRPVEEQIILPCRCGYSVNVAHTVYTDEGPFARPHRMTGPVLALLDHYDTCPKRDAR